MIVRILIFTTILLMLLHAMIFCKSAIAHTPVIMQETAIIQGSSVTAELYTLGGPAQQGELTGMSGDSGIISRTTVHFDRAVIRDVLNGRIRNLTLNLPGGGTYNVIVNRVNQDVMGTWTISGRTDGGMLSMFTMSIRNDRVMAHIHHLNGDNYRIVFDAQIKEHQLIRTDSFGSDGIQCGAGHTEVEVEVGDGFEVEADIKSLHRDAGVDGNLNLNQNKNENQNKNQNERGLRSYVTTKAGLETRLQDHGPEQVDVMIVYTPAARIWAEMNAGGEGAILNIIAQEIDAANIAVENSGVDMNFRLVHAAEVVFTESGNSEDDLCRLTILRNVTPSIFQCLFVEGAGDVLTEVHEWRDQYGADLVSMFTINEDYWGMAWVPGASGAEHLGFSTVQVQQAAGTLTLAHELGHNLGSAHSRLQDDRAAGPTGGALPYSTGWRWDGTDGNTYVSLMTYPEYSGGGFANNTGIMVPLFSNPDIEWQGIPAGTQTDDTSLPGSPANNAQSLRYMKHAIANYRENMDDPEPGIEPGPGNILYVTQAGAGSGFGNSWANAIPGLSAALDWAYDNRAQWPENPLQIHVASGIYFPTASTTDRNAAFRLVDNVAVYGGFIGTESALEERDWKVNVTVLSGDIDGNDDTANHGIANGYGGIQGSNSYTVVNASGTGETAVLDGFTITGGSADQTAGSVEGPERSGGGIFNHTGSPVLRNINLTGNRANSFGGAIFNSSGSPVLMEVFLSANRAEFSGGGMYSTAGSPQLTRVHFDGNSALFDGGGMYNTTSGTPEIRDAVFISNTAGRDGGGMFNNFMGSFEMTDVEFTGNTAVNGRGGGMMNQNNSSPAITRAGFSGNLAPLSNGGGMYNVSSSPVIVSAMFTGNSAGVHGGGMFNQNSSSPGLVNVIFTDNSAVNGGGLYNNLTSSPVVVNAAFSGNVATNGGGGIYNVSSSSPELSSISVSANTAKSGGGIFNTVNSAPVIRNSIVWGNSSEDDDGNDLFNSSNSTAVLHFSIYGGNPKDIIPGAGFDAGGNSMTADPLFADAENGDLHLLPGSPAINAGDPATDLAMYLSDDNGNHFDLSGNPRIRDGAIDIGAYEYQGQFTSIGPLPDPELQLPDEFVLYQNYPNPFNPVTVIRFQVPQPAEVRLEVFDVLGRRVAVLTDALVQAGTHHVTFNASSLPGGLYLSRLSAAGQTFTGKMILVK